MQYPKKKLFVALIIEKKIEELEKENAELREKLEYSMRGLS